MTPSNSIPRPLGPCALVPGSRGGVGSIHEVGTQSLPWHIAWVVGAPTNSHHGQRHGKHAWPCTDIPTLEGPRERGRLQVPACQVHQGHPRWGALRGHKDPRPSLQAGNRALRCHPAHCPVQGQTRDLTQGPPSSSLPEESSNQRHQLHVDPTTPPPHQASPGSPRNPIHWLQPQAGNRVAGQWVSTEAAHCPLHHAPLPHHLPTSSTCTRTWLAQKP